MLAPATKEYIEDLALTVVQCVYHSHVKPLKRASKLYWRENQEVAMSAALKLFTDLLTPALKRELRRAVGIGWREIKRPEGQLKFNTYLRALLTRAVYESKRGLEKQSTEHVRRVH